RFRCRFINVICLRCCNCYYGGCCCCCCCCCWITIMIIQLVGTTYLRLHPTRLHVLN
ncbi:GSCOCG00010226001-RA-CDS, partial [Cotesia congregata]